MGKVDGSESVSNGLGPRPPPKRSAPVAEPTVRLGLTRGPESQDFSMDLDGIHAETEPMARDALDPASDSALLVPSASLYRRGGRPIPRSLGGGRFQIERELGSGGEGIVLLAHDKVRRGRVALKMLHTSEFMSVGALKREFRFLRGLIHPNLAQLYELHIEHDEAFFTMAYIEGQHFLHAAARTHPLRPLLAQLMQVLAFLHARGLVHRDLKPQNILVQNNGRVVLVDFGAGLRLESDALQARAVLGTPEYIAPELLQGASPSPKSDSYSLGLVLFEALTQQKYLGGGTRPSDLAPELPKDLDELCIRLLDPDPEHRLSIAEALTTVVEPGTPVHDSLVPSLDRHRFAGRSEELLKLDTAFVRMLEGDEPVLAFLSGESGVGKTALLERFRSRRRDALVLFGLCSENEYIRHKAFDGVIGNLLDYLRSPKAPENDLTRSLSKEDRAALAQLFPELRELLAFRSAQMRPDHGLEPRAARRAGYRALARFLTALTREIPVVIAIDDLQWGDVDSARLIFEVFSGPQAPPCLLILSYRSDLKGESPCLLALRQGAECLEDELPCLDLRLGPLGMDESKELCETLAEGELSDGLMERLAYRSQGNPFLITELVNYFRQLVRSDRADEDIEYPQIIAEKVSALSPAARDLFALCCLGGQLPVPRVRELLGKDPRGPMDELTSARLCSTRAGSMSIGPLHDQVRRAFVTLGFRGDRDLHLRLARAFLVEPSDQGKAALHFFSAGEKELAGGHAEEAAMEAESRLALDQAVELFQLALDCLGPGASADHRFRLEERKALALANAGRAAEAATVFARLAETASPPLAHEYRRRAAEQWLCSGAIAQGVALLERVHREVGLTWPNSPKRALIATAIGRARLAFRSIPKSPQSTPPKGRLALRLETCRTAWSIGHISSVHGAANSARQLRFALDSNSAEPIAFAIGMEACFRAMRGTKARGLVEKYRATAERLMPTPRSHYGEAFLAFIHAMSLYFLSDQREAYSYFERAERLLFERCRAVSWELSTTRMFWASNMIFLGRHRELDRRMRVWLRDARQRSDLNALTGLQIWQARRIGLRDGDGEEAIALIESATAGWTSPYLGTHAASARLVASYSELLRGQPERALRELDKLEEEVGKTMVARVQVLRTSVLNTRGVAELTCALESSGSARTAHLAQVDKVVLALDREGTALSRAATLHLRNSVLWLRERSEAAISGLREAAQKYRAVGYELNAACIELVLGELLQGAEGESLQKEAFGALSRSDVDTQGRAARAYAPKLI